MTVLVTVHLGSLQHTEEKNEDLIVVLSVHYSQCSIMSLRAVIYHLVTFVSVQR